MEGVVVIVDDVSDDSVLDSINNTNDLKQHGDPNLLVGTGKIIKVLITHIDNQLKIVFK